MQQHLQKQEYAHSPRLNTVLMVEGTLQCAGQVLTVAELKRRLPKKVMHQTLLHILDYLQYSGKIIIGTKGVLWVFTERKELDKLINEGLEV
jgi:translation initiation factor RLI1